jgi:hypothetical protein
VLCPHTTIGDRDPDGCSQCRGATPRVVRIGRDGSVTVDGHAVGRRGFASGQLRPALFGPKGRPTDASRAARDANAPDDDSVGVVDFDLPDG